MIRITVAPPQWAIDQGIASAGDTDTAYFEAHEKSAMTEFKNSGQVISCQHVHAGNDDLMYVRGW